MTTAVEGILDQHPGHDVVLVGHGTAWTLVRSALPGEAPDLDAWARLSLPDVRIGGDVGAGDMLTP